MPPRTRSKALEGEIVGAPVDQSSDEVQAELEKVAKATKVGPVTVMMSQPNETQLAILLRLGRAQERDQTSASTIRLIEAFFQVMESLLPVEGDAQILEDLMAQGKLRIDELSEAWGQSAEDVPTNRRTRRARGK